MSWTEPTGWLDILLPLTQGFASVAPPPPLVRGYAGPGVAAIAAAALPGDAATLRAIGRGVLLGLGAAMPLGPVNVEIARRVLRSGFAAGVALGFGAVTVDVVYALVSAFSFVRLDDQPWVTRIVGGVGVCFLGYLGVQCLRAAKAAWRQDPLAEAAPGGPPGVAGRSTVLAAYRTGLAMTLLNPMTLVFWFTVVPATGGPVGPNEAAPNVVAPTGPAAATDQATGASTGLPPPVADAAPQAGRNDLPMMCAGVFIGTAAWVFTFASLLSAAAAKAGARRPGRRQRWLAVADAVGGVTLLGFAVTAFLRLVRAVP